MMGKKYLVLILIISFSLQAYSQTYRLKGGINLSDVLFRNETGEVSDVMDFSMPGFDVGATIENEIFAKLSLEYGVLLSLKGFKVDQLQDGITVRNKSNLYYLDFPLAFKVKIGQNTKSQWYLETGPLFSLGIAGNITTAYDYSGSKQAEKENVKWGDGEGELKRFDLGAILGGGVEFNRWQVELSYNMGLTNISNVYENTLKNRLWRLSVGYALGK
jgi:hypothetical protein